MHILLYTLEVYMFGTHAFPLLKPWMWNPPYIVLGVDHCNLEGGILFVFGAWALCNKDRTGHLPMHAHVLQALANVNIGSLICNVGAGGPAPAAGAAPAGGPAPSTAAAPAEEKKVEAKKEESEESDDDMGFGLFD